jgi:ABC-2 type transport system ATP-binding protein
MMTVARHIGIALEAYDRIRDGVEQNVLQLLHEFNLVPMVESRTSELSRGELYKVGLVSLLAVDTEFWIFDEPFASGMDPPALAAFRRHVHAAAARGRTILYTTQIIELAERLADQVLVLREGKTHAIVPREQFHDETKRSVLERMFDNPPEGLSG